MKMLFALLLAPLLLRGAETPNFRVGDILVLADGFIALKIENTAAQDYALPPAARDKVFISLSINGVKRAEYLAKAVDPAIFRQHSFIVFKTNFRAGLPQTIRVIVNGEGTVPETDRKDNILEKDLTPAS